MSIFDTSTKRLQESIYAALDAAAPDREKWLAGLDVFNDALLALASTPDRALELALDAAAPDGEKWLAGQAAFYNTQPRARWSKIISPAAFPNAQSAASRRPRTDRSAR